MPSITNCIAGLRAQHNEMTQKELAAHVGVTRQTVNAIEKNKYSPSLEVAFKISAIFQLPLTEVFFYADSDEKI